MSQVVDYKVVIEPDPDPSNPRIDHDNVTILHCAHGRYTLGDNECNEALGPEALREKYGRVAYMRPLYMMDHSGLALSLSPFSCPWDSGQVGWVVITEETMKREYQASDVYPTSEAWCEAIAQGEVETYHQFVSGAVYGYRIIEVLADGQDGEEVDACWGMYGHDYCEKEAESIASDMRATLKQAA